MTQEKRTPIALIIPYFGTLPKNFELWKMSALRNDSVDFLFFTDIDRLQDEGNLKVFHMSFDDFRNLAQKKFDFEISLNRPYKLCDFKPAYGYILSDYLKAYDFWGHCDIDLVFGDIRTFITEEILSSHDKILEHGHFTLYRNVPSVNEHFMLCSGYKDYDYQKAFSSNDSLYFDECLGMRIISRKLGIKTYLNETIFFDVGPWEKPFIHISGETIPTAFEYDNGKLYALEKVQNTVEKREIMYAHFQKRKMDFSALDPNAEDQHFFVAANRAATRYSDALFRCRGKTLYAIKLKFRHLKEYLSRYRKSNKSFREYRKERRTFHADMKESKAWILSETNGERH